MHTALLLLALLADPANVGTVKGEVRMEDSVLPGTTVTIVGEGVAYRTLTDVDGAYSFNNVPLGRYEVTFKLEGLETVTESVTVGTGTTAVKTAKLRPLVIDDVFPGCGGVPCRLDPSTSPTDVSSCSDYNLDTSLIDSASHGDRSAISLLKTRYDTLTSLYERHRIAAALLTRVRDDDRYWKELLRDAENAVRSIVDGKPDETLVAWCAEQGWDADEYSGVAYDALALIGSDPRSHDLLLRALKSEDDGVVFSAIWGLGEQHDEASLPEIERVIERFPKAQTSLATCLVSFKSEAADRIAFRYLEGSDRDAYRESRNAIPEK